MYGWLNMYLFVHVGYHTTSFEKCLLHATSQNTVIGSNDSTVAGKEKVSYHVILSESVFIIHMLCHKDFTVDIFTKEKIELDGEM